MINKLNWLRLRNQTAIVTGASSGIGSSIAKSLFEQGCNVILADVHDNHETNRILHDADTTDQTNIVKYIRCDVTNKTQVQSLIGEADIIAQSSYNNRMNESTTGIDKHHSVSSSSEVPSLRASILVNAAGITRDSLISNMEEDDYDSVLNVNLKGTFLTCQEFCSHNRVKDLILNENEETNEKSDIFHQSFGGSIINIGSIISQTGNIGQCNYAASKGGVYGFTKSLAKEMAYTSHKIFQKHLQSCNGDDNNKNNRTNNYSDENDEGKNYTMIPPMIRVNAILPGFIVTPMSQSVPTHIQEQIRNKIALRRFGHPDEIANLALFLASSYRSSYITGECLECSGMIRL